MGPAQLAASLAASQAALADATRRLAAEAAARDAAQTRAARAEAEGVALRAELSALTARLSRRPPCPGPEAAGNALTAEIVAGWIEVLAPGSETLVTRWLPLVRALRPYYPGQAAALVQVIAAQPAPQETRAALQLGLALIEEGEAARGLALVEPFLARSDGEANLSSRQARLVALARDTLARAESEGHDPGAAALRRAAAQVTRSRLRIATIMDEFTALGYAPDCDLQQLSLQNWQAELEDFAPDLLLLESAWRGLNEDWGPRVGQISAEIRAILAWCRARDVPTAFWNKEDPVHFETFLNLAQMVDLVFTTDIDCIPRYKAALGHGRVHLLPFAAQPELHNPVEQAERRPGFCFAGAYYVRYLERTRDLDDFLEHLSGHLPFEIFDRNFGKDHPDYMFPEAYRRFIIGTLPPSQIDRAYKGYDFGINLNSVKSSQSMFARRVYELLASNTRVVSNYAAGLRRMFGDLVIATDSGAEALRRIRAQDDGGIAARLRLAGLRKVMSEHTYAHRVGRIARAAGLEIPDPAALPRLTVLGHAETRAEAAALLESLARQLLEGVAFMLVVPENLDLAGLGSPHDLRRLSPDQARGLRLADLAGPGGWLAGMVAGDYHGPHYLTDLMLATRYSPAPVLGKAAHHRLVGGQVVAVPGPSFRATDRLALRRAVLQADALGDPEQSVADWLAALPEAGITAEQATGGLLALDPFGYCEGGAAVPDLAAAVVDDPPGLDTGIPGQVLEELADALPPAPPETLPDPAQMIAGAAMATDMAQPASGKVTWSVTMEGDWQIASTLDPEEHLYIYEGQGRPLRDIAPEGAAFPVHPLVGPGLGVLFVVVWQDAGRSKIDHQIFAANRTTLLQPPAGTAFVRFAIRPRGPGACTIRGIKLAPHVPPPRAIIGPRSAPMREGQQDGPRVLVLTNHYPSHDDLYRNAFVHSRLLGYRDLGGLTPEVFRLRPEQDLSWHEFQGIEVMTGSAEQLDFLLASGRHDHVLVHFLDPAMWAVLARHIGRIRVTVWVHGAEVQPWWRRAFNYATEAEQREARKASDERLAFWRRLFDLPHPDLTLVFVSRHFADEVLQDLGVTCPPDQLRIIHNPIDDALFAYHEKPVDQRGRILSIRPFASAKYANDLSVRAILALRAHPDFDRLAFRIIGDGPLFDTVTAPLSGLANVSLERRFLPQQEIAELQRDYGVFLNPTRWDSQGVSRDEAMSAGLVPVTSRNSAVPEFIDEDCGYLVETEDAEGLARAMIELWENPEIFAAKSRAAAERVRADRSRARIIRAELALFDRRAR